MGKLARELGELLELLEPGLAPFDVRRAKRRREDLLEEARLTADRGPERLQVPRGHSVAGEALADDHDVDVGARVRRSASALSAVEELILLERAHEAPVRIGGREELVQAERILPTPDE